MKTKNIESKGADIKRPFTSITRTALLIALAACLLTALTVDTNAASAGGTTAVKITILDASGDRIRSDGRGAYINGVNKVTAWINTEGSLYLNTGSNTKPDRKIFLDFSDNVLPVFCDTTQGLPDFNCNGLQDDPASTLHWASLRTWGLNLLNMAAGETVGAGFTARFFDNCPNPNYVPWTISFLQDGTEFSSACSHLVKVEAFDAVVGKGIAGTGVDKWIISAELVSAQAGLWSGVNGINSQSVLCRIVRVPFHLLVELQ